MVQQHPLNNLILCPTKSLTTPSCFNSYNLISMGVGGISKSSTQSFWWKSYARTSKGLVFYGLTTSIACFKLSTSSSLFDTFLSLIDVRRVNKSAAPLLVKCVSTISFTFNLMFYNQKILFLFFFGALLSISTTSQNPLNFQIFYWISRYLNLRSDVAYDLLRLNSTHV